MTQYFDTHCHLDYLKQAPTEEVIAKCQEIGVNKMISIATEPDNLDKVLEISKTYPGIVYCSQGIHPHDAKSYTPEVKKHIEKNIKENTEVVALGEIGLDYHYDLSPRDAQIKAFESQMQLAIDNELPIIIHTREAEDDTWSILNNFIGLLKKPLVLHSFTSKIELAEKALNAGFHIGFNGIVTFKNAQNVRAALDIVPIDKLLLETDAPFLTPTPHRGKENAPFYLPHSAQFICKHREWEPSSTLTQIYQNSLDFFQIS